MKRDRCDYGNGRPFGNAGNEGKMIEKELYQKVFNAFQDLNQKLTEGEISNVIHALNKNGLGVFNKIENNDFFKNDKTNRGFGIAYFSDDYGVKCSLQISSSAMQDKIWLGVNNANPQILASKIMKNGKGWVKYPIPEDVLLTTRMHLTREQALLLAAALIDFANTGEI